MGVIKSLIIWTCSDHAPLVATNTFIYALKDKRTLNYLNMLFTLTESILAFLELVGEDVVVVNTDDDAFSDSFV